MAGTCRICDHPERANIDKALEVPRSDSTVSRQYGFARVTIARHRAHLALKDAIAAQAEGAPGEIRRLKALAEKELTHADPKVRLAAQTRLERLVELEIRARAQEEDSVYLYRTPAFGEFLTMLLKTVCEECAEKIRKGVPGDTPPEE